MTKHFVLALALVLALAAPASAGQLFPPVNEPTCEGTQVILIWNKSDGTVSCKSLQDMFSQLVGTTNPEVLPIPTTDPVTGGKQFTPPQPTNQ